MAKRDAVLEMVVGRQCIPRPGEIENIAEAVAFLASDASEFINGQVLNLDGGWAPV